MKDWYYFWIETAYYAKNKLVSNKDPEQLIIYLF